MQSVDDVPYMQSVEYVPYMQSVEDVPYMQSVEDVSYMQSVEDVPYMQSLMDIHYMQSVYNRIEFGLQLKAFFSRNIQNTKHIRQSFIISQEEEVFSNSLEQGMKRAAIK